MSILRCINCGAQYDISRKYFRCDRCGDLLEVTHKIENYRPAQMKGVWKYKDLIHPDLEEKFIVTRGEGDTFLYEHELISEFTGIKEIRLKHEGENPTGSFKDRGMTVAVSHGKFIGARHTICASTGNTSASASSYSSLAGMKSSVLIPKGKISRVKLIQSMAYGAEIVEVQGDFDKAMENLESLVKQNQYLYTLNSLNPWRLEGQKTIFYEIMDRLKEIDFILVPAGNLGNTSALGKAIADYYELGIISKKPKIAAIQAEGASPFYKMWHNKRDRIEPVAAETVASAIRIGNPVNWKKAIWAINYTEGIVETVSDSEILEAKKIIDKSGIGSEPASAASVAGAKKLREKGIIDKYDRVAAVLTGHVLKDIDNIAGNGPIIDFNTFLDKIKAEF